MAGVKVVFSSPNFPVVAHFRGLLESEGIPCWIRNEYLGAVAGELPPLECWPQVCVAPDWEAAARAAIERARAPVSAAPAWDCAGCGERLEGQFTACWRCGTERP